MALSAIIKHKEKENGEYHSTTLAKRADKWYSFDDTKVQEISEQDIANLHLGGTEQIFIYTHKASHAGKWTMAPKEKDKEEDMEQSARKNLEAWPTLSTLTDIILHRTEKGLTTDIGQEDIIAPTTETICEDYTGAVYSSMNADTRKINTYKNAIRKATRGPNTMNIDLGCGENAILYPK